MRWLAVLFTVTGISLVLSENARAQQLPSPCGNWDSVSTWNGTVTITGAGQSSDPNGSYSTNESATITGQFTVGNNASPSDQCDEVSQIGWVASPAHYSVTISNQTDTTCRDQSGNKWPETLTYAVSRGTFSAGASGLTLDFTDAANPTLSIDVDQRVDGLVTTFQPDSHCGSTSTLHTDAVGWGPASPLLVNVPLPSGPAPLTGSRTFQALTLHTAGTATWTVTWNLIPNPRNLDLILMIPGYDTWRPAGGLTEKDPGADPVTGSSVLLITAELVDKDTGAPVNADKITFLLSGVSREPGVAMNWPAKGKATGDPDLSFDPNNPFVSVSDDGTKAEAMPQGGELTIAFLTPHDWGAWGTLKVTAEAQGQTVDGHFEGDTATDILLPKRQPGSHIADGWKTSHKVPLDSADMDDPETEPEGLEGCTGDGLTLYEEYRGFMENKKHIEGDPVKKDFFIRNAMGGEAEAGIRLFTRLTGLTVHKDLKSDEFEVQKEDGSLGDRVINFNHGQGAHQEFDQHGVAIDSCAWDRNGKRCDGGMTYLTKEGVRGRPGLTTGIVMQMRDEPGALAPWRTHHGAITASDAVAQYDIGVAHELAHSVGVEHHGEGDLGPQLFAILAPNDPRNPAGVPLFLLRGTPIRLLDEVTGADLAAGTWQKITKTVQDQCKSTVITSQQSLSAVCTRAIDLTLDLNNLSLSVGVSHGQHSGDATCIMRYFFSNAYQSEVNTSTYFMVGAGTEAPGRALCKSPAGTGINAPDHQPQPRYFDAASLRGACQSWVCVNDKYAPVSSRIP